MRLNSNHNLTHGTTARAWLTKILSAVLLFVVSAVHAQLVIPLSDAGDNRLTVRIDSVRFAPLADSTAYGLHFSFAVTDGRVPKGEYVVISPQLSAGSDAADFPAVGMNSKEVYYRNLPGGRELPPLPFPYKDKNTTAHLHYNQTVASAAWMQSASLVLRVDFISESGSTIDCRAFILRAPVRTL